MLADRYDEDTFKDSGFKEWLSSLSDAEKKSMTAASALDKYKASVVSTNSQVSTAATVTSKLTSGLKGIAGTIGSSLLNFGASMAVMAGISALFKLIDTIEGKSYDDLNSAFSESSSAYEKAKSELESVKSQLSDVDSQIETINSKGTLTLADEAELGKLQSQKSELQQILETKQAIVDADAQKAGSDALAASEAKTNLSTSQLASGKWYDKADVALNDFFAGDNPIAKVLRLLPGVKQSVESYNSYTDGEVVEANLNKIKELKKEQKNIDKWLSSDKNQKDIENDSSDYKDKMKRYEEITSSLADLNSEIVDKKKNIESQLEAMQTANAKNNNPVYTKKISELKDQLNEINHLQQDGLTEAEKKFNSIDEYFNKSGNSGIKSYFQSLANEGKLTTETISELGIKMSDIGDTGNLSDVVQYFNDMASSADNATKAVSDYSVTVADVTKAGETTNKDNDWSSISSAYKTAKELLSEGKTGVDDFQSVASFLNPKKIKEEADNSGKYIADAYQKAFEAAKATADRWFGEDEANSMKNFVNDFKDKGLWDVSTDDMGLWDIQKNFTNTAEAADKFGVSVNAVETMLHGLEAYGYDFGDVMFSGEKLNDFKTNLDGIKNIYNSLQEGAEKDRLGKLIENWDTEYQGYCDDISTLTSEEPIVKIKFEYDLASIQQKIDEVDAQWEAGDHSAGVGASRIAYKQQKLDLLEGRTEYQKAGDTGYNSAHDKLDEIKSNLVSAKSEKDIQKFQEEKAAYLDMMNSFNQYRLDGNDVNWDDYLGTDSAKQAFKEILDSSSLTQEQLEKLFGQEYKIPVDVELDMSDDPTRVLEKLNALKDGESIKYTATVDGIDGVDITALKNEDGTITYKADIDGVKKDIASILDQNGNITYTTSFDGTENWINENLEKGCTLKFNANLNDVNTEIQAVKDQDGNITYYATMDDGSQQAINQQTDENGKITFTADTSQVENVIEGTKAKNPTVDLNITANAASANAVITQVSQEEISDKIVTLVGQDNASDVIEVWNTLSPEPKFAELSADDQASVAVEVWNGLSAYPKFTELSAEDQATAIVNLWNALEANPKSSELSAEDKATAMVNAYNSLYLQNKESVISQTGGEYATSVAHSVAAAINNIPSSKTSTITTVYKTIKETISKGVNAVKGFFGFGSVAGTAHLTGTAFAGGSYSDSSWINPKWQTKKSQVALVGEESQELVVDPSSNTWYTVGDNGAEFRDIPKGAIIFNHKQTENLFKNGHINSRGKGTPDIPGAVAFASGTAYRLGSKTSSTANSKSSSSKKNSSSSSSKSSSKNSSTSSSKSNSSSDSSNDKEETKETLDWIETKLDRIKRKIDELDTTASSTYRTWSKRNEALSSELSKVTEKISLQQQAYDRYIKEAGSAGEGLSSDWIDKIQNGKIDIETITDSDLKEKISDYKNW